MFKNVSKILSLVLALLLALSVVACLADVEYEEVYEKFEKLDSSKHTVYFTTWEYPVVDGERTSGKPVEEGTFTEKHEFKDGKCVYCGYEKEEESSSDEAAMVEVVAETFTVASGVELTKGTPAAQALKQVFAAIPANTEVTIAGVPEDVAAQLLDAINGNATVAELLAVLANFPVQTVDGVECYVVTLTYGDVTENYAFSTADGTLVAVF